jgi:hypothetical protein
MRMTERCRLLSCARAREQKAAARNFALWPVACGLWPVASSYCDRLSTVFDCLHANSLPLPYWWSCFIVISCMVRAEETSLL